MDFNKLKQELSGFLTEGDESYDFNWVGKKQAIVEANKPTRKFIRPDRESSVDWKNTQNIYIEGDNIDVLKLLQKSYLNKIKVIYIDPPYNTGHNFVYRDKFTQDKYICDMEKGLYKDDENIFFQNTEPRSRFHSVWCSMIYARLKLAKNLLSDDGFIFISIDYHELNNLQNICNEIFGEDNQLGLISVINNLKGRSDSEFFATCNEFLLVYARNKSAVKIGGFKIDKEEIDNDYKFEDEISKYKPIRLRKTGNAWKREERPYMYYPILYKDDKFQTVKKEEYKQIYNSKTHTFNDKFVDELKTKY